MKKKIAKARLRTPKRGKARNVTQMRAEGPVMLSLIVTRRSGDEERYMVGNVPDLMKAIEFRRWLNGVKVPKVIKFGRQKVA